MNAAMLAGLAIAAVVGALLPIQAGANGALGRTIGEPMIATFWSLLTSTLVVGIALLFLRPSLPPLAPLARLPAWAWIGGLFGALFVGTATVLAPRLGAAAFTVAVVAGQLAASVSLDATGALGYAQRIPSPGRLLGIALVLVGGALVALSNPPRTP
jgi:transporter family-2 protein